MGTDGLFSKYGDMKWHFTLASYFIIGYFSHRLFYRTVLLYTLKALHFGRRYSLLIKRAETCVDWINSQQNWGDLLLHLQNAEPLRGSISRGWCNPQTQTFFPVVPFMHLNAKFFRIFFFWSALRKKASQQGLNKGLCFSFFQTFYIHTRLSSLETILKSTLWILNREGNEAKLLPHKNQILTLSHSLGGKWDMLRMTVLILLSGRI